MHMRFDKRQYSLQVSLTRLRSYLPKRAVTNVALCFTSRSDPKKHHLTRSMQAKKFFPMIPRIEANRVTEIPTKILRNLSEKTRRKLSQPPLAPRWQVFHVLMMLLREFSNCKQAQ